MEGRHVNIAGIFVIVLLIVVFIFGFDFLKRTAAKNNPNNNNNLSILDAEVSSVTSVSAAPDETQPVITTSVTEDSSAAYKKAGIDESKYYKVEKMKGELGLGELILINKDNSYKFHDISSVLVQMAANMDGSTYKLSYNTHQIHQSVMTKLNEMMSDFYKFYSNRDVTVVTAHLTYDEQKKMYIEPADDTCLTSETEIAPGYSEHHSGYAIDFKLVSDGGKISTYDGTGIYSWLNDNCYKYGFVIRYPEGKESVTGFSANPAHFRFVGIPHSYIMHENGFTLEEYLKDMKKYTFGYEHREYSLYGYDYEIYYVPVDGETTIVPVPQDRAYSLSGNNYDGFIVTICTKANSVPQGNGAVTSSATVTEAPASVTTTASTTTLAANIQ